MLKLLLLLVLAYLVLRAAGNLIRAVLYDGTPPRQRMEPPRATDASPFDDAPRTTVRTAEADWNGTASARSRSRADIQDAKWKDL